MTRPAVRRRPASLFIKFKPGSRSTGRAQKVLCFRRVNLGVYPPLTAPHVTDGPRTTPLRHARQAGKCPRPSQRDQCRDEQKAGASNPWLPTDAQGAFTVYTQSFHKDSFTVPIISIGYRFLNPQGITFVSAIHRADGFHTCNAMGPFPDLSSLDGTHNARTRFENLLAPAPRFGPSPQKTRCDGHPDDARASQTDLVAATTALNYTTTFSLARALRHSSTSLYELKSHAYAHQTHPRRQRIQGSRHDKRLGAHPA